MFMFSAWAPEKYLCLKRNGLVGVGPKPNRYSPLVMYYVDSYFITGYTMFMAHGAGC